MNRRLWCITCGISSIHVVCNKGTAYKVKVFSINKRQSDWYNPKNSAVCPLIAVTKGGFV